MRETEIEYEVQETEQERVYCDSCAGDCTDDYEIVPQEVCSRCADEHDPDERFFSVERFLERYETEDEDEDEDDDEGFVFSTVIATLFWWLLAPFSIGFAIDPTNDDQTSIFAAAMVISTMIWVSAAYLIAYMVFVL